MKPNIEKCIQLLISIINTYYEDIKDLSDEEALIWLKNSPARQDLIAAMTAISVNKNNHARFLKICGSVLHQIYHEKEKNSTKGS